MRTSLFRTVAVVVAPLALITLALGGCAAKSEPLFTATQATGILYSTGNGDLPEGVTLQRGDNATVNLDSFLSTQTATVTASPDDCVTSLVPVAATPDGTSALDDQVTSGAQLLVTGSDNVPVTLTQVVRHAKDQDEGRADFEASRKAVERCNDISLTTPDGDIGVQRTIDGVDLAVDAYRITVKSSGSVIATEWVLRSGNVIASLSTSGNEKKISDVESMVATFAERMAEGPDAG